MGSFEISSILNKINFKEHYRTPSSVKQLSCVWLDTIKLCSEF